MAFFSRASLDTILAQPASISTLYASSAAQFKSILGSAFADQPEDHIKLAFASVLAYELKPYGSSMSTTLEGLLASEGLHCGNYSNLSWRLYQLLSPSAAADVTMFGWTGGVLASHSQLFIATPGHKGLLLDPTIGHVALFDGVNPLLAGKQIPIEHQASFFFRDELAVFQQKVQDALSDGTLRGGNIIYWFETVEYSGRYLDYPTPQREFDKFGETNNLSLSSRGYINAINKTNEDALILGGAAGERIFGGVGEDFILGGGLLLDPDNFTDRGLSGRQTSFFSTAQLSGLSLDISQISGLFASERGRFIGILGAEFSTMPENHVRMAFAMLAAHEMKMFGAGGALELPDLLAAASLDSDGYALLAWHLFNALVPGGNPDVVMLKWNGGIVGEHSQLLISAPGTKALLVDPTIGLLALTTGYNELVGGEAVSVGSQRLLSSRTDLEELRGRVISALDDGLYRGGDMAAWFESPGEAVRYDGLTYWATPQGEVLRTGSVPLATLGELSNVDVIRGGSGSDMLIGDGIVHAADIWTMETSGHAGWYIGDFDGDGRDDIFSYRMGSSGAWVQLSTGAAFDPGSSWTGQGHGSDGWYIGDFDGDGRDDIFRYMPGQSGAEMFLSTGVGFASAGSWTGAGHGAAKWFVGDFNGDGLDDIFRYMPGKSGAEMFLSTGSGFKNAGSWTGYGYGTDGWYVGDFDGDGRDDILRYLPGTSGAEVFLSTGTGFQAAGSWTGYGRGEGRWIIADIDGDGRADLVGNPHLAPNGTVVLASTGAGFALTNEWSAVKAGNASWLAGDFNGDGRGDFLKDNGASGSRVFETGGFGRVDADRFYFAPGELNGDVIGDFQGAGAAGGDELWFAGFGEREDMTLSNSGDMWTLRNNISGAHETFRLIGVTALSPEDYFFV